MSVVLAGATAKLTTRPDPVEVFTARAEARAYLWAEGEIPDLHEAVDALQAAAVRTGLVAELGQDAVQAVMAKAFAAVRKPYIVELPPKLGRPDPFPSAGELQKIYDTGLRQEREKYGAEESTVEAVMYALRVRGAAALRNERTRQRIVELSSWQLNSVIARLARLRGKYPKITDDLLLALAELLDG